MTRARVLLLTAALGPLDYRVPRESEAPLGSVVLAPLGPRRLGGVVRFVAGRAVHTGPVTAEMPASNTTTAMTAS